MPRIAWGLFGHFRDSDKSNRWRRRRLRQEQNVHKLAIIGWAGKVI